MISGILTGRSRSSFIPDSCATGMAGKPANMVECEGCGAEYNASDPAEVAAHAACGTAEHIEQA